VDSVAAENLGRHEGTGWPLDSETFVMKPEGILDRILKPKKASRPKAERKNEI